MDRDESKRRNPIEDVWYDGPRRRDPEEESKRLQDNLRRQREEERHQYEQEALKRHQEWAENCRREEEE